jgi:hypothetical protein
VARKPGPEGRGLGRPAYRTTVVNRGDDDELVAVPAEARLPAVDADRPHLEPVEVEVEAAEPVLGARLDPRGARQPVRAGDVAEPEPVVAHVVATVAGGREVRVADARRSGA